MKDLAHSVARSWKKVCGASLQRSEKVPDGHWCEKSILFPGGLSRLDNSLEHQLGLVKAADLEIEMEDMEMYHLQNVCCTGNHGHIFFDADKAFTTCSSTKRLPDSKFRLPVKSLAKRVREPLFHLTGFSHDNHGHFLIHHLPRLVAALAFINEHPEVKLLVADGHQKWQARYLKTLGIDSSRLYPTDAGTLAIDNLYYVPIRDGTDKLLHPRHYKIIQAALRKHLNSENRQAAHLKSRGSKAIWFHRQGAPDKRLTNEGRLIEHTRRRFPDLLELDLGDFSLPEQIALLDQVDIVFGPLGQALTSILFAKETKLVILTPGFLEQDRRSAACMFRSLALVSGNHPARFYSETGWDLNQGRSWEFPLERYERLLDALTQL